MITVGPMPNGARKNQSRDGEKEVVTIPAPSGVTTSTDEVRIEDAVPSARPTAVPDYDVEALAAATSLEIKLPPRHPQLPPDLMVPVRKRASADGASFRAAFLLSHVDDRMSVADIAMTAQIPIAEATECFVLLTDLGIIELRGAAGRFGPLADGDADAPTSGEARAPSGLRQKP
jgi:hypothetical protein